MTRFHQNVKSRLTREAKKRLREIGFMNRYRENLGKSFREHLFLYFQVYFYDQTMAKHLYLDYLDDEAARKSLLSSECFAGYLQNYDLFGDLYKIQCPTLMIHGDFDPIPFDHIQRIHRHIAGSAFVLFEKCGHFAHIEKSKECFDIIKNFLRKHARIEHR
jgi:proline iminopeptidase